MAENREEVYRMRGSRFGHEKDDCSVIALAKLTGMDYAWAHDCLKILGRKDREGSFHTDLLNLIQKTGCYDIIEVKPKPTSVWTLKCHSYRYPGRYLVRTRISSTMGHVFVMVEGKITDDNQSNTQIIGMWEVKEKKEE